MGQQSHVYIVWCVKCLYCVRVRMDGVIYYVMVHRHSTEWVKNSAIWCVKTCTILCPRVFECNFSFTARPTIPGLSTDSHSVEKAPYRKEVNLPRWYKAIKKCANLLVPSYPPWAPFYWSWCRPCWASGCTRPGSMVVFSACRHRVEHAIRFVWITIIADFSGKSLAPHKVSSVLWNFSSTVRLVPDKWRDGIVRFCDSQRPSVLLHLSASLLLDALKLCLSPVSVVWVPLASGCVLALSWPYPLQWLINSSLGGRIVITRTCEISRLFIKV